LSGAFSTGETNTFVEAITAYFPIQVAQADERTVILRARQ
jgi:transmembrane sensor